MRASANNQDEYIMLCRGLERMASLYKAKKNLSFNRKPETSIFKTVRFVMNNGIKEAVHKYRVHRSGVDRFLPNPESETAELKTIRPDNYFCDEKIAVYMAEFGEYDEIMEPVIRPDNIDYYLLTDRSVSENSTWKWLDPSACIPGEYRKNPVLANRWCKMHPHVLFPQYRYSVYIDSNTLIVSDFTALINRMGDYPVSMFQHKNRDCVYDEIEACLIKKKAARKKLIKHRDLLKAHGVPHQYGLAEATVIARRHMEQACISMMQDWWQAFLSGSGRDQITLIDVLWRSKINPSQITVLGSNLYQCDLFIMMPHHNTGG